MNMIQLSVDTKVGVISAGSDGSSPLQFTIRRLSSSTPHVVFTPLRALRKKGGVVRPVSPSRLCEEPAMKRIYDWGSHQAVLAEVAQGANRPRTILNC